jgi:hypothetical protein
VAQAPVWFQRFSRLRTEAGLTFEQALVVYELLDAARAFGTQTIADSAWTSLQRAYDRDQS